MTAGCRIYFTMCIRYLDDSVIWRPLIYLYKRFFYIIGIFVGIPIIQKPSGRDAHSRAKNFVAKATALGARVLADRTLYSSQGTMNRKSLMHPDRGGCV